MKVSFLYSSFFLLLVIISSLFYSSLVPFITTTILARRKIIIVIDIVISMLSFLTLLYFQHIYLYVYTLRALTYLNLFIILSDIVNKPSIIDIFGEKGIPIVIALSYYPYFYDLATQVLLNMRSRKEQFNPIKISRPIIVEMLKVAENLYLAYTIKLFGKYSSKRNFMPAKDDIIITIIGVATLCLSFFLHLFLVR